MSSFYEQELRHEEIEIGFLQKSTKEDIYLYKGC